MLFPKIVTKLIQSFTRLLEGLSPFLASRWARILFTFPTLRKKHDLDLEGFRGFWLDFERTNGRYSKVRCYEAGAGPTVLLLHGWEGSVHNFQPLAHSLVTRGFRVLMFDFPAHGVSPERRTNALEVHRIVLRLQALQGPFLALVGHSFGGVVAGYSLRHGVHAERLITIGSPTSMDFVLDRFSDQVRATGRTIESMKNYISSLLTVDYSTLSLVNAADSLPVGGLVVHDVDDRVIPYSQAESFHQRWDGADLIRTRKLGHSRILKDRKVLDRIIEDLEGSLATRK